MQALVAHELGSPDVLTLTELADPHPEPHQVVIDVTAAGVNFPDGLIVAGTYQTRYEPPVTPGCEVAGTILEVGADVAGLEPGQRVMAFCGVGGYATRVAVDAAMVFVLPDGADLVAAAGMPVTYGTSYHGLVDIADLQEGETLLVLGAAGGVGLTAVEIGHRLGAEVVAAASSQEKLDLCHSYGATTGINYSEQDLRQALKDLGTRVDVVYDPVGGEHAEAALRSLGWRGRYLSVGYASGTVPKVGLNRVLLNEGSIHGVLWGAWAKRDPAANAANFATLGQWHADGSLRPHIDRTWPLADGAAALQWVMDRQARGKCILTTGE